MPSVEQDQWGLLKRNSRVRDLINDPRTKAELLRDRVGFNRLASALDAIEDTQSAISAYPVLVRSADKGAIYLAIFGLLQAFVLQQDAVRGMAKSLGLADISELKSEELVSVRNVRIAAAGHLTDVRPDKTTGRLGSSNYIVQHSVSGAGFELYRLQTDGKIGRS